RGAEHVYVSARAEDARLKTLDYDDAYLRVLEAKALDCVGEFDVNAQVVRVELELVALAERRVLLHVHREGCDRAVGLKLPVPVTLRRGLEVNHSGIKDSHGRKYLTG